MKIRVPIEVDVNLTPYEIICYIRQWIYPILKEYQSKGSDWYTSKAIVKDGQLYWQYQNIGDNTQINYETIKIQDQKVFNLCKAGVELLEAYSEIHAKSKYAYINGCN